MDSILVQIFTNLLCTSFDKIPSKFRRILLLGRNREFPIYSLDACTLYLVCYLCMYKVLRISTAGKESNPKKKWHYSSNIILWYYNSNISMYSEFSNIDTSLIRSKYSYFLFTWWEKFFCGVFFHGGKRVINKSMIKLFEPKSQVRTCFFQIWWKNKPG